MKHTSWIFLGDLLDDRQLADQVSVRQIVELHVVLARSIDDRGENQCRVAQNNLVESTATVIHPGDAGWEGNIKLMIQRPQEMGELRGVRIKPNPPLPLFHNLKVRAKIRIERK